MGASSEVTSGLSGGTGEAEATRRRTGPGDGSDSLAFCEKLVALLDTGSLTTSNEYTLLLGLFDVTVKTRPGWGRLADAASTEPRSEGLRALLVAGSSRALLSARRDPADLRRC